MSATLRLCVLGALLLPALVLAQGPLPRIEQPVTDLALLLPEDEEVGIEAELHALQRDTGVEMAVLLVDTTGTESIESYSLRVAQLWQGRRTGSGDGLLLTLAIRDRRLRLEVGSGLEATLPEDRARQLLDAQAGALRQGHYRPAISGIIGEVRSVLAQRTAAPGSILERKNAFLGLSAFGALVGVLAGLIAWRWSEWLSEAAQYASYTALLVLPAGLVLFLARGGEAPVVDHLLVLWVFALLALIVGYLLSREAVGMGLLIGAIVVVGTGFAPDVAQSTNPRQLLITTFINCGIAVAVLVVAWFKHATHSHEDYSSRRRSYGYGSSSSSRRSSSSSSSSYSSSSSSSSSSGGGGGFSGGGASSSW